LDLGVLGHVTTRMLNTPVEVVQVLSASADAAVVRCRTERGPLVVKVQAGGKELASSERMALRLLTRAGCLAVPVTPLVGVSVVIMEDLGDGATVDQLLHDFDPGQARAGLVGLAEALGAVHRYGHEVVEAFGRGRAGPPRAEVEAAQLQEAWRRLPAVLEPLQLSRPEALGEAVRAAVDVLASPGGHRGLTHGDALPGNGYATRHRGVVLVDFERAGLRHVLSDVAQWYVGPPIPVAVRQEMVQAWQRVVAPMWPDLQDADTFATALDPLLLHRGLLTLCGMLTTLLERDVPLASGFGGRAVLLSVLSGLAWRDDPLGELAQQCLDALDTRWSVPLPSYPAFEGAA